MTVLGPPICPCGEVAEHRCSDCGRLLCAMHHTLRDTDLLHVQRRVCKPGCHSWWWRTVGAEERRR